MSEKDNGNTKIVGRESYWVATPGYTMEETKEGIRKSLADIFSDVNPDLWRDIYKEDEPK